MILIDTGPIVAAIDKRDGLHQQATRASDAITDQLITTEACITEALYFMYDAGGWSAQRVLRDMVTNDDIRVLPSTAALNARAFAYIERFHDIPCDYADATLLVAAEGTGVRQIFTFDKHFYAYRLTNGNHLDVIP